MNVARKSILTLILLLIVYGSYFFSNTLAPKPATLNVLGADTNISLFIEPIDGRAPIINAINAAEKEILVEVYLMSDKEIINSLIAAKQRGVSIEVMLEQHPFGGGNLNNTTQKSLEDAGINFEWTNSTFSLTHEKSIVIDNNKAFILNQNLTTSSFSKNREYDILDTNPEDVTEIRTIFIDDWQRKTYSSSTSTHLIVSPITSRAGLTTLIQSAAKTIDIEMEVISDDQIVNLLIEKARITQVRILVPTVTQINSNKDSLEKLKEGGVIVKTLSSPYIHAKLILIDYAKAYIGSVNLSAQSMDKNRELGIILINSDNINTLFSNFNKDWDKSTDF